MKNQTESGIKFLKKKKMKRVKNPKKQFPFFNIKKYPLVLSAVTFSYQTVSHSAKAHEPYLDFHHHCLCTGWWRCTLLQEEKKNHQHADIPLLWVAEYPPVPSNTAHRRIRVCCSWAVLLSQPSLGK